jgi:hypothetical protein
MSQDTQDMADASNGVDISPSASNSSTLGNIVGSASPQMPNPQSPGSPQEQDMDEATSGPQGGGGSRLQNILAAVAKVGSTALSGIPDRGRPSFAGGLGEGARAEQADQANQQNIKFKTFDDSVRAATLHNQDLELQARTQEQQDAHQKFQDFQSDYDDDHGITMNPHPNDGDAVMQTLQGQTAATGYSTITPGTHLAADGKTINVPSSDADTQAGLMEKYKALAGILPGVPSLPPGASFVPPKNQDVLTHVMGGYDVSGNPLSHDQLKNLIPALQAQRDALAKNNATPYQLGTLDNLIGIYTANEKGHQDAEDAATAKATANAATLAGAKAKATADATLADKEALANNAAANKAANAKPDAQMYVGTDAAGNQIAGTSADLATAGAQGVTKLDSDTGKKVITARQLIAPQGLFGLIKQDMLKLDAAGKMGSSATARFNDAMLQKAGADPDYAPLFVHTHLLSTALMQAHVGSRGSSDMMEEFQKLANAGKMNAATLRASLGAEYNYVREKAMLPKAQPTTGGQ